jgi:hypothetical protein
MEDKDVNAMAFGLVFLAYESKGTRGNCNQNIQFLDLEMCKPNGFSSSMMGA